MKWFLCECWTLFINSLIGNWLRDHISWALSGIGVKIKSLPKNFWSSVLNFTTPRYAFLFSNSETYIVHVINCEWSRSVNFSATHMHISNMIFLRLKELSETHSPIFYFFFSTPPLEPLSRVSSSTLRILHTGIIHFSNLFFILLWWD